MTETSANRIYDDMRREILLGRMKPGDRIDVSELATRFLTSKVPVREALVALANEGLIRVKYHSGYFVRTVTLKELRDLLQFRQILELAAVDLAVQSITPEQVQELKQVHSGYTGYDDESRERYLEENRRFHYLVAKASGNAFLADQVGNTLEQLNRFLAQMITGERLHVHHNMIADALGAKDCETATQLMKEELEKTRTTVMDLLIRLQEGEWNLPA
jgi:DNA-binding GntR family transcriptional regulator